MSGAESPKTEIANFDKDEKKWQVRSTQVTVLVALIGLAGGGYKYFTQRDDSLKTAKIQSQRPFLEKQQSVCFDAVGAVGALAAENEPGIIIDTKEHANALNQFWTHFHGTLSVVENDRVEAAMVAIGNQLRQCEPSHQECDLQNNANHLAHACRDLMRAAWDVIPIQYNQ